MEQPSTQYLNILSKPPRKNYQPLNHSLYTASAFGIEGEIVSSCMYLIIGIIINTGIISDLSDHHTHT